MLKPSGGFFKKMFSPDNMAKKLKKPIGAVRAAGRGVGLGRAPGQTKRMPSFGRALTAGKPTSKPAVFTKQAPTAPRDTTSPRVGIPGRENRRPERVY